MCNEKIEFPKRISESMKRFKIDIYYDDKCRRFSLTEFVEGNDISEIKPTKPWFSYYKIEEDVYLEKPVIFKANFFRYYKGLNGCENTEILRTVYVLAHSYFDAMEQLKLKLAIYRNVMKYAEISKIVKDEREPLDILLTL